MDVTLAAFVVGHEATLGASEQEALNKGMEVKSAEFVESGSEIYKPA